MALTLTPASPGSRTLTADKTQAGTYPSSTTYPSSITYPGTGLALSAASAAALTLTAA